MMGAENHTEDAHGSKDDPTPIKSLQEYFEWVNGLKGSAASEWIYRGLEKEEYLESITSAAFRRLKDQMDIKGEKKEGVKKEKIGTIKTKKSDAVLYYQKRLIEEVRSRGYNVEGGKQKSDLEILAELQHQGAATCLIDFTKDPFVALWFACQGKGKQDGAVFVMNSSDKKPETSRYMAVSLHDLNEKTVEDFLEEQEKQNVLWKWRPDTVNINRVLAQESIFVFGKPTIKKDHGFSYIIPADKKMEILHNIDRKFGINERSLFYDFTGLAQAHSVDREYVRTTESAYRDAVLAFRKRNHQATYDYCDEVIKLNQQHENAFSHQEIACVHCMMGIAGKHMVENFFTLLPSKKRKLQLTNDAYYVINEGIKLMSEIDKTSFTKPLLKEAREALKELEEWVEYMSPSS